MDKNLERLMMNKTPADISNFLVGLNKLILNKKEHIRKYNTIRNLHREVLESMAMYIENGKYNIKDFEDIIFEGTDRIAEYLDVDLFLGDEDDQSILLELFVYKNHKLVPSITEIYLKNNKFRNKEKIKMLESMNNSFASLFKVVGADPLEGYITYEDVFTGKKYKVIDIAMSSTTVIDKKNAIYIYNRIITYDGISFGTGIHCMMSSKHKRLKEFIKNKNFYNNFNDYCRCIILYNMSKSDNELIVQHNNRFSNRRRLG